MLFLCTHADLNLLLTVFICLYSMSLRMRNVIQWILAIYLVSHVNYSIFCRSNGFESPGPRSRSQSPTKRSSRFQKPNKHFKPRYYDVISDYNPQFFSTSGRIEKEVPLMHGQRVTVLGKSWQFIIHLYHSSFRRFDYKIMSTTLFVPLYQCDRN